jgi:hypothetical protein
MELTINNKNLINGYDEVVKIEDDLLFPLLKNSEIANGNFVIRKKNNHSTTICWRRHRFYLIKIPKTLEYLNTHIIDFMNRKGRFIKTNHCFQYFL